MQLTFAWEKREANSRIATCDINYRLEREAENKSISP